MTENKIAAFFDFDKTLLLKESAELGVKFAWERGTASLGYVLKVVAANPLYKMGLISSLSMAKVCLTFYRKRDLAPLIADEEKYWNDWVKPNLSQSMLEKLKWHQDQGHVPVILSGSLRYYLEPTARRLGIKHVLCTDLEIDENGIASGNTDGPILVGEHKKEAAFKFAEQNGIDLKASYSYGDHESDYSHLATVGHPVAVRPDSGLRALAVKNGWEIIDSV